MFGCYTRNKVDNEMPNLTLENIANACEGTYVGDPCMNWKIRQDHIFSWNLPQKQ